MLELLNTFLWGPGTLALILGTGAWLTLRTGGFPQRNLGRALALSLGREARRKGRGGVSPFGSLMTALASTVGTGNIVGVAAALVSGGPGALVWMELAALLGLASKFAECMLAVKYRRVRRDGTRWGGPMAVMETRLGPAGAVFGRFYALFALLMAFAMGAMAQSGALADTLSAAFTLPRWRVGLVTAALTLTILLGGIRRIADISTVLVPVIMVTAMGDTPDRIGALRYGADDYVVKPYHPGEVVARVQAVLRRVMQTPETPLLRWLGLEVDTAMMTAGVRDERGELAALVLTPTEFSLLATLMQAPVRPFSRQHLLEHCLPESDALERSVDTHVYNLRRKLETAGISGVLVNVRGVGYRFSQP